MIIIGSAAILDSIILLYFSHINFGTAYPSAVGLPLLITGIFYNSLLPILQLPIIKWLFIAAYALSTIFIVVMSAIMLISASNKSESNADAIIVLGCASRYDRPSLTLKNRLDAAIVYMNNNPNTIAVLSGGVDEGASRSEAAIMQDYMLSQGIAESRLIKEARATSTETNFIFSMELINKKLGARCNIVFTTTRFHVFRSGLTAKKLGISAVGIPADGALITTVNDYIRESFVIIYYYLCGKI